MATISKQTEALQAVTARLAAAELTPIQKAAKAEVAELQRVNKALAPQPTAAEKRATARAAEKKALAVKITNPTPTQQLLQQQEAEAARIKTRQNYTESEDFLRIKAFEVRNRITLYKNLGLQAEYAAAQQEGAAVVAKYQALVAKGSTTDTTA